LVRGRSYLPIPSRRPVRFEAAVDAAAAWCQKYL